MLTSLAFVVGQVWIGVQSLCARGARHAARCGGRVRWTTLPVGGALEFDYPGAHDPCLLIRADERTLVAYSQKCTHLSCAVVPRIDEGVLHCPCHEGSSTWRPAGRIAGPPPRPLPRISWSVAASDVIYATGV